MSETLTTNLKVSCTGTLSNPLDIGNRDYTYNYSKTYSFTNGTGADMANQVFTDTRTIAASTTEDLDLAGGLTNAMGTTLTFTKIKAIIISAAAANTNNVLVGGDANAMINFVGNSSDIIVVRPGGTFCVIANDSTAYAVTGATGDILQIANSSSGSGVTYDIVIIGCV